MFSVTVRDHVMIAHSFAGRGLRAGAAAARRDVRRGRDLPRPRPRTPTGSSSTSAGRPRSCTTVLADAQLPQPRRRAGVRRAQHLDRGAGQAGRRPAGRAGRRRATWAQVPGSCRASWSPCTSRTSRGPATSGPVTLMTLHFLVPAGFDDPRPSGGNVYDRRLRAGLVGLGWDVHEHRVAGRRLELAGIPDGAMVLVDGLVASGPRRCRLQAAPAAARAAAAHGLRDARRARAARPRRRGGDHQRVDPALAARALTASTRTGCTSPSPAWRWPTRRPAPPRAASCSASAR